jgi:hypothetical protein
MKTIIPALPLLLASMYCKAKTALCRIEIQNILTGAKQTIEQVFELSGNQPSQRKHFNITGSEIRCTLVFIGLGSGTALGCELDELGHNYIQSDRSTIQESQPKNKLTFRIGNSYYELASTCN